MFSYTFALSRCERGAPPLDVMIARNGYHSAHLPRIANENRGPLKFARSRALAQVAGDHHHVELPRLDDLLDCLDLLRNRGPAEMEIRDVEDTGHGIPLDIAVRSGCDDEIGEMRGDAGSEAGESVFAGSLSTSPTQRI